jgi:hypothetical protein
MGFPPFNNISISYYNGFVNTFLKIFLAAEPNTLANESVAQHFEMPTLWGNKKEWITPFLIHKKLK